MLGSVAGADVLEGETMRGPCMCGADDCPRCHPGCDRLKECERCRDEFRLVDLDRDGLCEECASKAAEEKANENKEDEE